MEQSIICCMLPSPSKKEFVILRTKAADIYIPIEEAQQVARAIINVLEDKGHTNLSNTGGGCLCRKAWPL